MRIQHASFNRCECWSITSCTLSGTSIRRCSGVRNMYLVHNLRNFASVCCILLILMSRNIRVKLSPYFSMHLTTYFSSSISIGNIIAPRPLRQFKPSESGTSNNSTIAELEVTFLLDMSSLKIDSVKPDLFGSATSPSFVKFAVGVLLGSHSGLSVELTLGFGSYRVHVRFCVVM